MNVYELNREQLIELKQNYLEQLSNEGVLNEVLYGKEEMDDMSDGVSYGELADADNLVPDAILFDHYEGYEFSADDFSVAC